MLHPSASSLYLSQQVPAKRLPIQSRTLQKQTKVLRESRRTWDGNHDYDQYVVSNGQLSQRKTHRTTSFAYAQDDTMRHKAVPYIPPDPLTLDRDHLPATTAYLSLLRESRDGTTGANVDFPQQQRPHSAASVVRSIPSSIPLNYVEVPQHLGQHVRPSSAPAPQHRQRIRGSESIV